MKAERASNPADESPWMSHRRVLASAAMLGAATVLVKLVALIKDWMVARRFGASDELDAFLIAFMIPSYAVAALGHSVAQAFIPTYLRVYEDESPAAAGRLVGGVLIGGLVLLVIVSLLLGAVAPFILPVVGSGFDESKLRIAQSLLHVLLGVLVVSGISAILAAVLNAHERFAVAAIAPLAVPVSMVVAFALFQDRYGIHALAAGTLAGFVLECCVLAAATYRHGLLPWPSWSGFDATLRDVASRYWPIVVGSLLMASCAVVDQSMAASLASGNVSILNYGNKIVALVLSIVAVSLSTVLLPRFSRMIAAGGWDALRHTFNTYAKLILVGSIPVVTLLILLAEPMIALLFQRGAFTPETTEAVSRVQIYLSLQIPFYVIVMLGTRVLSALNGNRIVLCIGALNLLVNVVGNYVLMQWFGVDGIAMSTSLAYLLTVVVMLAAIRFKMAEAEAAGRLLEDGD